MTRAAVLEQVGAPLAVADLEIGPPGPGQVLVEISMSGVCHTQVLEARGHRGPDPFLPHCLGHEGVGTVRDTGTGVRRVRSGDHVVLSWIKGAGADVPGTTYRWGDRIVNAGGVTTFNRHALVSENRLTVIPAGLEDADAVLLGCAVATGFGAVFNTAQARPGQRVAVFGAGGIGLCAIAAAVAAGCTPIIAIDPRAARLDAARALGASDAILAAEDAVPRLLAACPGGVDVAIEATGRPEVMAQALSSVRNQGGAAVVIGNARHGEQVSIDPRQLNLGKRLLGTWGGDSVPERDFPRYARLLASGRVRLDALRGRRYTLGEVDLALDDLESGRTVRPVIDMSRD
jgi:S-(hydroxymethyl)glutathione dehydrogenase/alcohol dehydrogenase